MSSDLSILGPKFTETTLLEIVQKIHPGSSVSSWEIDNCSTRGSSYLSEVSRLNVTGVHGEKEFLVKAFVKCLPKNQSRKQTFRSAEFFNREIEFYDKIWAAFEDFQTRHNVKEPYNQVPKWVNVN